MMDELEALFEVLDEEETERAVSVELGRAVSRVVLGETSREMPLDLDAHVDVLRADDNNASAVQLKAVGLDESGMSYAKREGVADFVGQVAQTRGKVAQSAGLSGAGASLGYHAEASMSAVHGVVDWSAVPLGVDRAMERDARRYDGGF